MAMDETSCRGRTKHRTSEERTPVGTQSAEGYCRKCDQRDPGRRRDELPEAPQSFLAHFSVLPDERMERDAHPARPASPQYSIPMCLRITFSGSTDVDLGEAASVGCTQALEAAVKEYNLRKSEAAGRTPNGGCRRGP